MNQCGVDYVGLLVLGTFNASVPANLISGRFESNDHGSWTDVASDTPVFELQDRVLFEVVEYEIAAISF